MTRRLHHALAALAALAPLAAGRLPAQTLDRSRPPELPPPPRLELPPVRTATLGNGLRLHLVEMREVPLVHLILSVAGGGREDAGRPGLAAFTGNMLDEGADTLDAFGIAARAAYLGAALATGADWDRMQVSLKVPTRTLEPALDLMADVALRPNFPTTEVARQRQLRLAEIVQERDQPEALASLAFNAVLFPAGHPYHHSLGGDSASVARFDSAAVRQFYGRVFRPERAEMFVAGDVTLDEARRLVEEHFGGWGGNRAGGRGAGGRRPAPGARAPAPPVIRTGGTTIYLVDKPGAPQSVIRIGGPGVDRTSPDFYALEVMNTILGGTFSSRLMSNLREAKGYTYGASSRFVYRPLPGPFVAGASVRTDVTDSSLVEFFRELQRIRDSAVTDVELERAKANLILGLPGEFETTSQVASRLAGLATFGLPLDYYETYIPRIRAVTAAEVQRVARRYISPGRTAVVVVGDAARVRPALEALRLGPVRVRGPAGEPVPPRAARGGS